MPNSPTIYDARAAREVAIHRVSRNANPEWTSLMFRIGVAIARQVPFFTTNEMFDILDGLPPGHVPYIHDRRALGPVMRDLDKAGVCEVTRQVEPCRRRHCAPLYIWRSKIYIKPMLMLPSQ